MEENSSKHIYNYTVLLEKEEDGGYHAFCPILKGCHSQGDSFEEAVNNITEAIELYVESLIEEQDLLNSVERGEWRSLKKIESAKLKYKSYTLNQFISSKIL